MANRRAAVQTAHYDGPTGGWGSLRGITRIFGKEWAAPAAVETLVSKSEPHGFICVRYSRAKPALLSPVRVLRERRQGDPLRAAKPPLHAGVLPHHTVMELKSRKDRDLEQEGRLSHPMRYDASADRDVPCGWDEAFAAIGAEFWALDPKAVIFYA